MLRKIIITARKQQGFTQRSLAETLGIRQATLSEFESGKRSIRSDTLEKIIKFLEIEINLPQKKRSTLLKSFDNSNAHAAGQSTL